MKNIVRKKKLICCITLAVLLLGIGALLCFTNISFSANYYDAMCKAYGSSCVRVHNTQELINAYDQAVKSNKSGIYHFVSDPNENIDTAKFKNWYKEHYVLDNWQRNYYTYAEKGDVEPDRYNQFWILPDASGNFTVDFNTIRNTTEDKTRAEYVGSRIVGQFTGDGSQFQKAYNAYRYLIDTTSYITDDGFEYLSDSNTGIRHTFVDRKSVCIGFSIAYSYLLDKLGIESYIVDQVTENDYVNRRFSSVHSFNVIKLDGKYYKVDVTGKSFLSGISRGELKGGSLSSLSSSGYKFTPEQNNWMQNGWHYDANKCNEYVQTAKKLSVTKTTKSPGTSVSFSVDYDDEGNYLVVDDTTTTKFTYTTVGGGNYQPGDYGDKTTNMGDYLATHTSVIVDSQGNTRVVTVKPTTVKTTKRKYIKVFTTVKTDNGTTRVINYKVNDNGEFEEISLEEANKINKSNKLVIKISKRNKIILGAIVVVCVLIGIQVYRYRHYKTGTFTTIEFTLGNRTDKNDDYSNFAATNYDENRK